MKQNHDLRNTDIHNSELYYADTADDDNNNCTKILENIQAPEI